MGQDRVGRLDIFQSLADAVKYVSNGCEKSAHWVRQIAILVGLLLSQHAFNFTLAHMAVDGRVYNASNV